MELNLAGKTNITTHAITGAFSSPEVESKLHYLLDALASMDARIEAELAWLEKSSAEEDLKDFIRQDILSRHSERRMPLANAVEELKQRHHAPEATHNA